MPEARTFALQHRQRGRLPCRWAAVSDRMRLRRSGRALFCILLAGCATAL